MAIKTTLEQIEEVQEAITEVMTSQELEQPGNSGRVVRARLSALTKRENMLLERYHRERGRGLTVNIGIPGRR